jgi:hypothetical protein
MLKRLNGVWERALRQKAAWVRWNRKLPRNRVRRQRIRDSNGRPVGYTRPTPVPEPGLPTELTQKVSLPSGRVEVRLRDPGVAAAYRIARRPKTVAAEVVPLPLSDEAIRQLCELLCSE